MRSWGSAFDRMIAYVIAAAAVVGLVGLGAYDLLGTHGSAFTGCRRDDERLCHLDHR